MVTLTEKRTKEKIDLLTGKNLYAAAIVVAYADPSYQPSDIIHLYRSHAEHLYSKGDFGGAMEQYILTIGALVSSHVIFCYLDAPKIPHLVKYLSKLREMDLATPVHNELLRTCYLKLNDKEAAQSIVLSSKSRVAVDSLELDAILTKNNYLQKNPKEAMATICSLEAHQVAKVLVKHGTALARVLPCKTMGIIISLAVGTYLPSRLASATKKSTDLQAMINATVQTDTHHHLHNLYPVSLFANALMEHPKMLRLLLQHANRQKCILTPSLRRTLLELTLREWNQARRTGDTEVEKLRHKEAIAVREQCLSFKFLFGLVDTWT